MNVGLALESRGCAALITPVPDVYEIPLVPLNALRARVTKFAESTSIVLLEAIVPPPDNPLPAIIETPPCATCSSATNPDKLSCLNIGS